MSKFPRCEFSDGPALRALCLMTYSFAVQALAMTISEPCQEWECESAFSDDSDMAQSFVWECSFERDSHVDQRLVAKTGFAGCPALENLWLVEHDEPPAFPWTAAKDHSGGLLSVRNLCFDDEEFAEFWEPDWRSVRKGFDRDGFPTMLSFPPEIMSFDEKFDPPSCGKKSNAEQAAKVSHRYGSHPSV